MNKSAEMQNRTTTEVGSSISSKTFDTYALNRDSGKELVEALTSSPRDEAYAKWARLDTSNLSAATDPDHKDQIYSVIVDNTRDPNYKNALSDIDFGLSVRASRTAYEQDRVAQSAAPVLDADKTVRPTERRSPLASQEGEEAETWEQTPVAKPVISQASAMVFVRVQDSLYDARVTSDGLHLPYARADEFGDNRNTMHWSVNSIVTDSAFGKFNTDSAGNLKGQYVVIADPAEVPVPAGLGQVDTWIRMSNERDANGTLSRGLDVGKSAVIIAPEGAEVPENATVIRYQGGIEERDAAVLSVLAQRGIEPQVPGNWSWAGSDNQKWAKEAIATHYPGHEKDIFVGSHGGSLDETIEGGARVAALVKTAETQRLYDLSSGVQVLTTDMVRYLAAEQREALTTILGTMNEVEKQRIGVFYNDRLGELAKLEAHAETIAAAWETRLRDGADVPLNDVVPSAPSVQARETVESLAKERTAVANSEGATQALSAAEQHSTRDINATRASAAPVELNTIERDDLAPEPALAQRPRVDPDLDKANKREAEEDLVKRGTSARLIDALTRPFRTAGKTGNEMEAPVVMTKSGYSVPAAIESRYTVQDGDYWRFGSAKDTQSGDHQPAFRDHGPRLATSGDDRGTVADMVAVAQAKGWQSVKLKGTEEFRRAAWVEASLAGIQTKGFEPQAQDRAMLDAARREREALTISRGKAPEVSPTPSVQPKQAQAVAPSAPAQADVKVKVQAPAAVVAPGEAPVPTAVTAKNVAAVEPAPVPVVAKPDVLVAHGHAPYLHDAENSDSYFVTVRDQAGQEKTSWGVDLERAIDVAKVQPGDAVSLENLGAQQVTIQAPIKNEQGKTVGYEEKLARRNIWEVTKEASQSPAQPERAASVFMDVNALRKQVEDAIAGQPDNVKRAVMDRFAERLQAGLEVQAEHNRTSAPPEELAPRIVARVEQVDAERIARVTIEQAAAKHETPRPEVSRQGAPTMTP